MKTLHGSDLPKQTLTGQPVSATGITLDQVLTAPITELAAALGARLIEVDGDAFGPNFCGWIGRLTRGGRIILALPADHDDLIADDCVRELIARWLGLDLDLDSTGWPKALEFTTLTDAGQDVTA